LSVRQSPAAPDAVLKTFAALYSRPDPEPAALAKRRCPADDAAGRQPGRTALSAKAAQGTSPSPSHQPKGTNNIVAAAAAAGAHLRLAGVALYQELGYRETARRAIGLRNGLSFGCVDMEKLLERRAASRPGGKLLISQS
jgi:hypothetical protein